jgi:hypothetical protein
MYMQIYYELALECCNRLRLVVASDFRCYDYRAKLHKPTG